MMILSAQDQLANDEYRKAHAWVWPEQLKQLAAEVPDASDDFKKGYELGLQTARVYLQGDMAAVQAKVSF